MNTSINTTAIESLGNEYRALQERIQIISHLKSLLSGTRQVDMVFEIVIPAVNDRQTEARIRGSGNLREMLHATATHWVRLNVESAGRTESDAYVFIVFGEQSVIVPGKVIEEITGIRTNDHKAEFKIDTVVVESSKLQWA